MFEQEIPSTPTCPSLKPQLFHHLALVSYLIALLLSLDEQPALICVPVTLSKSIHDDITGKVLSTFDLFLQ